MNHSAGMPIEDMQRFAGLDVPHDRTTVPASCQGSMTVLEKCDRGDPVSMTAEACGFPAPIPHPRAPRCCQKCPRIPCNLPALWCRPVRILRRSLRRGSFEAIALAGWVTTRVRTVDVEARSTSIVPSCVSTAAVRPSGEMPAAEVTSVTAGLRVYR